MGKMPIAAVFALLALQVAPTCQTYLLPNPASNLFAKDKVVQIELPPIPTDVAWTEALPSWNVDHADAADLVVEARVVYPDHATKYYSFGHWSGSDLIGLRSSVSGQKDEDGTVLTDTLRMTRPGGQIQFRLTGRVSGPGPLPKLSRLFVNVCDTRPSTGLLVHSTHESPWGIVLDPPQFAQGDYPGGKGLCSPTSVAMVLSYWSGRMGAKNLAKTVAQVQSGVFDSVYGGTGNWAFNTAYAGSKPGLLGYAARLNSIDDLENWISKGIPVVCSVSWYQLHGQVLQSDEEGHLIVLVGFTKDGDPVFNDPGKRGEVRKVYKRSDFEVAWAYSKRTTYIICPPKFVDDTDVVKVN